MIYPLFAKKLEQLDVVPIALKLMNPITGYGWSSEQTCKALVRYQTFLLLIHLYPNLRLVPTLEIDQVWHEHILQTRKYREDCQMLFGRFIDHEPCLEPITSTGWQYFNQTKALLAIYEPYFRAKDINIPQVEGYISSGELALADDPSACGRPVVTAL